MNRALTVTRDSLKLASRLLQLATTEGREMTNLAIIVVLNCCCPHVTTISTFWQVWSSYRPYSSSKYWERDFRPRSDESFSPQPLQASLCSSSVVRTENAERFLLIFRSSPTHSAPPHGMTKLSIQPDAANTSRTDSSDIRNRRSHFLDFFITNRSLEWRCSHLRSGDLWRKLMNERQAGGVPSVFPPFPNTVDIAYKENGWRVNLDVRWLNLLFRVDIFFV